MHPLSINGVGGRVFLTHKGNLRCLPATNNLNLAYYSAQIPTNLISLGHLQRCGASYGPDPLRPTTHFIIRSSPTGPLIGSTQLSPTNLLPVDFLALQSTSPPPPLTLHQLQIYLATKLPRPLHYNAEQLQRANAAEDLHTHRHHPSDNALCADLSHGKIKGSYLTPRDVRLNRLLRGPCPHCTAGKLTAQPSRSSMSPPATCPGDMLSFDIHMLPEPAPGGLTHAVHLVDEFSGRLDIVGATTKHTLPIFRAIHHVISTSYNSQGYRVRGMHGDAERINASLLVPLGIIGTRLQLSRPGDHARRIERYERTINEHSLSTLSSLPYILPQKYTLALHKSVASALNDSINSRSDPLTPNEILSRPSANQHLAFGRCAMVTQPLDKRQSLAQTFFIPSNQVPKAELGVSMGPDALTASNLFLLANGLILPRRAESILPPSFVPFNWTPKQYHMHLPLIPLQSQEQLDYSSSNPIV